MLRFRWPVLLLLMSFAATPFLTGCDYDDHDHRDRDRWHEHHDYDRHDYDRHDGDRDRW